MKQMAILHFTNSVLMRNMMLKLRKS